MKLLSAMYRCVMLAAALCLVSGCNLVKVNDVRLASVELVDPSQESVPVELTQWNLQGRLVKLTFITKTNIRDTARKLGLHLRADAHSCGNREQELAKMEFLFDRDGVIGENPVPSSSPEGTAVWLYVAERSGPGKDIETGKFTIPAYDLVQDARDVCVRLHGRNMALEGFSSNVVRVSSEELRKALEKEQ